MKTIIAVLAVGLAVIAGYFGVRYFTHRDLGFTPARKYIRNLAKTLLHAKVTAASEAGAAPVATAE